MANPDTVHGDLLVQCNLRVSGSITPDTYTIDKGSFKILEKKIHEQTFKIVRKGKENIRRLNVNEIEYTRNNLPKQADIVVLHHAS